MRRGRGAGAGMVKAEGLDSAEPEVAEELNLDGRIYPGRLRFRASGSIPHEEVLVTAAVVLPGFGEAVGRESRRDCFTGRMRGEHADKD